MSHIKFVCPSGWNFGELTATLIKVSSRGLIGSDRSDFIKRAGASSNVFLPYLDSIKVAKDEMPAHLIALGAYEHWGCNRNGDAFYKQACLRHYQTFEKFARLYRNHANKDPKKSYGYIKKAAYNDPMSRIELLAMYNATKEAAERNCGLVADREVERLARGEDLSGSMACSVPFDECSACGHRARTRDEYCTTETCKAGGCRDNLTRVVKVGNDVHHLHVKNDIPRWFDYSDVYRPADYTAYGSAADYLTKAAANHGFFGIDGYKLAEDLGMTVPIEVVLYGYEESDPHFIGQLKIAYALDLLEKSPAFDLPPETNLAFAARRPLDLDALDTGTAEKAAAVLGAMADTGIILPLPEFARLTKRAYHGGDISGVIGRMVRDGTFEARLANTPYPLGEKTATESQLNAVARVRREYSLEKSAVEERVLRGALRGTTFVSGNTKTASCAVEDESLARDYACYQIAALERIAGSDRDLLLTAQYATTQNQLI